jgi:heme-degrading monooxygenase HmoA
MSEDHPSVRKGENANVFPGTDVSDPITLINAFSLPAEESGRFVDRWKDNARAMASQPGFVRAKLFTALNPGAELLHINVTEWESGTALDDARKNPEWLASRQRVLNDPELHVTARPEAYMVALEVMPGDALP